MLGNLFSIDQRNGTNEMILLGRKKISSAS